MWEFHERLAQKAGIEPEMPPATTGTSGTYSATWCRGLPPTYLRRIRCSICLRIARWTRGFLSSFKMSRRVRGFLRSFKARVFLFKVIAS